MGSTRFELFTRWWGLDWHDQLLPLGKRSVVDEIASVEGGWEAWHRGYDGSFARLHSLIQLAMREDEHEI